MSYPVIDLFAGPGGLGEGFSTLKLSEYKSIFKIALSIEKDQHAHKTLELRAFFRQFSADEIPEDYYSYISGKITREELFNKHSKAAQHAQEEAWLTELGSDNTPEHLVDEKIRKALGNNKKWVLIGGPPCQAYSLVGRSRVIRAKGLEKYEADPKHKLYRHYLRILAVHQPPVFVMENVKGLLSAKLKNENTIDLILKDLRNPLDALPEMRRYTINKHLEYRLIPLVHNDNNFYDNFSPADFVVKAEEHGIPQARHRIIIIGVRSDINARPNSINFSPKLTIDNVISDLPVLRSGLSQEKDSPDLWQQAVQKIIKGRWINYKSTDSKLRKAILSISKFIRSDLNRGQQFIKTEKTPIHMANWFHDKRMKGVCNHETRSHIREDLHRYLFAAVFSSIYGRSPLLDDFPKSLLPEHRNIENALKVNMFNDRFRVQIKGRPSTTIVSHISKDGHYYIHYDPIQCRGLTVREAARLQTFPDNYFFEGPRTEQYKQVGNAVPPYLAYQIAEIIAYLLKKV